MEVMLQQTCCHRAPVPFQPAHNPRYRLLQCTRLNQQITRLASRCIHKGHNRVVTRAEDEGREGEVATKKEEEEVPSWIRAERERKLQAEEGSDLPFPVYLIGSALVAIAAVGSIFEFANKNAIFGVVKPDNFLWAPILLFFAITGFPSAAFLFLKAINSANKESERQDKLDGY